MFLKAQGWMDEAARDKIEQGCREEVMIALKKSESEKLPHINYLFTDVYDDLTTPKRLLEQRDELADHLKKYGDKYPGLNLHSDKM